MELWALRRNLYGAVIYAGFAGGPESAILLPMRDNDRTWVLGWPGYKVYRHEIDELGKRLNLWVRRKRANKLLVCSGCGKPTRGRRGRGAAGKTIVFGLLKRDDKVYTQIMSNVSRAAPQAVIRNHASFDSTIRTDGWSGCDGLIDLGYERHFGVHDGDSEFAVGPNPIDGIESFWGFAEHRSTKFHGVNRSTFPLHLKETEFRFNPRNDDLYKTLLSLLRKNPL
jgi:transposase-like protein